MSFRGSILAVIVTAFLSLPAGASGAVGDVLGGQTMNGQPIACATQSDGVRVCHGTDAGMFGADQRLKSFDGVPLDIYVTLPPIPESGPDGNYPLVIQSHGWGAPPTGPDDAQYGGPTAREWAKDGYVVMQLAARGWGESCGSLASRLVNVFACAAGYLHLDDYRFEARDAQNAAGLLVDEGIADPNRIGATGESYGGGMSLALATLKDRMMKADGSLGPWTSPDGTPMRIAAGAPFAGWSDLVSALIPNGRTDDSQTTPTMAALSPIGVKKDSILSGLYLTATLGAYMAPAGLDPNADVTGWISRINAGEPYETPDVKAIAKKFAQFRSPYYLLAGSYGMESVAPAPLLLTSGFTDDIFPVDESLRYYNLARSLYPSNPISMMFYDGGHQRASNKPQDGSLVQRVERIRDYFDHYVKGTGAAPASDVTAFTQTCPATEQSGGPYTAATWNALHPGEVSYDSAPAKTVLSTGGDPLVSLAFDPVVGGPACRTASATDQGFGVATYRLPAATGSGYTLLGSPTITAKLSVFGLFGYVAARLLDVDPAAGTETLVSRGLYRLNPTSPNGTVKFQLHPNGWRFKAGHIPKLELLGQDAPYSRASNGSYVISVSSLKLQLPVNEVPGAPGTPAEVYQP